MICKALVYFNCVFKSKVTIKYVRNDAVFQKLNSENSQ